MNEIRFNRLLIVGVHSVIPRINIISESSNLRITYSFR